MSCCCNSSPCVCAPCCPEACPEIVEYDASNINLAGVGVFDAEVANEFQFRGIRSANANLSVVLNAGFHTIDLTIDQTTFKSTTTFANAATRANTVPAFEGQFGYQLDTDVPYVANGVAAGNWIQPWLIWGTTNLPAGLSTTTIQSVGHNYNWQGLTNSVWTFDAFGTVSFDGNTAITFIDNTVITFGGVGTQVSFSTAVSFNALNGSVSFAGGWVDFGAAAQVRTGAVPIPINSLVRTSAVSAGQLTSDLISAYLSTNNTSVGWGDPTGGLSRLTFNTAAVTLPQLAERVAALIFDLKAALLPAT